MTVSPHRRNLFASSLLAVVAGLSLAPSAIALPQSQTAAEFRSASPMLVAQAQQVTATVLEIDLRDDMIRVRLPNGSARNLSVSASNILRLGLERGAEVTLNMSGTQVVSMSHGSVTVQPNTEVTATVLEVDARDDMVRVQLPDGDIRTLLLSGQDIVLLGLTNGAEVTLNMEGDRILTMSRMVNVQARQPITATVLETDARDDMVRVRLADGSIRTLLISEQDIQRLRLRRGSEVMLGSDGTRINTMFAGDSTAAVAEAQ